MVSLDSKIQKIAEDCAHSFKGLYKESDIREKYSKFLILLPIVYSIWILVFPDVASTICGKVLSIATLVCSVFLLVGNKSSENIVKYREIANDYKRLYDALYLLFGRSENKDKEVAAIVEEKNRLNGYTSQYPIGFFARIIARMAIRKEMNLDWLSTGT